MATLDQTSTGDLALTAGKSLSVVTGAYEAAIKLRSRLKLSEGEWFLDTRVGTPHFQRILGQKNPDLTIVKALFSKLILSSPGIASLASITCTLNKSTRVLNVSFQAVATSGALITATDLDTPYIVTEG